MAMFEGKTPVGITPDLQTRVKFTRLDEPHILIFEQMQMEEMEVSFWNGSLEEEIPFEHHLQVPC